MATQIPQIQSALNALLSVNNFGPFGTDALAPTAVTGNDPPQYAIGDDTHGAVALVLGGTNVTPQQRKNLAAFLAQSRGTIQALATTAQNLEQQVIAKDKIIADLQDKLGQGGK